MIQININEIIILSLLFTFLAITFNIHAKKYVISFVIEHLVALLVALLISGLLYYNNIKKLI